jgi:hypothetical protein
LICFDEGLSDGQRRVEQPLDGRLRKVEVHPHFLDLADRAVQAALRGSVFVIFVGEFGAVTLGAF